MRVFVHDYGGYAFIAPLSRSLARRGHEVTHAYCGSVQTPQGLLQRRMDDPGCLRFEPISLPQQIQKRSFVKRWKQERQYASLLRTLVRRCRPDVIISADTPSTVQASVAAESRRLGIPFVSWVQDLYGLAAYEILRKKLPIVGAAIGRHYMRLDESTLRRSHSVILITEAFRSHVASAGVCDSAIRVIANWAPIEELPERPKDNPWAARHGLADRTCLLYSGTLLMKHNPSLLLDLARQFRDRPDVRVVVVSEGDSAAWLRGRAREEHLTNLLVLPFQPFSVLPDVLATADVLVCVLEPDAGRFSVPSKVLTYLCAGRAMLLSVPSGNLSATTVLKAGAGVVVSPTDHEGFLDGARGLIDDSERRRHMGHNGRRYAEKHFDIEHITDQFEEILVSVAPKSLSAGTSLNGSEIGIRGECGHAPCSEQNTDIFVRRASAAASHAGGESGGADRDSRARGNHRSAR